MRSLQEQEIRSLFLATNFRNGQDYVRQGKVADTWQTEASLHATVVGTGKRPYQVNITDKEEKLVPRCTCPAYRRQPFCKHVAAVLITWVQAPERFVVGQAPVPPERPKGKRSPRTRVDRRQVQTEGLGKVEDLLVELTSYGLLSLTKAQVDRVDDLAHTAESHKLRRLARLVGLIGTMLRTALTDQEQFDEARYAELLSDAWLTAQATRRAITDIKTDPAVLEDLIGKTWREKDLEHRENVRLLELAYETAQLETGFTVDTSYLLSLGDGMLYTERQIVPSRLRGQKRKSSYAGRLEGTIGLYPGPEPRRVKLIEMAPEGSLNDADWEQALSHADRMAVVVFDRFKRATANPLAPPESYALFAPARTFVDGPVVHLLDDDGQSLTLAEGWRVLGHLAHQPVAAIFGRLTLIEGALRLTTLGLIAEPPKARLIRMTGSQL